MSNGNNNLPRKRRHLSAEKRYGILEEIKAHPERKGEILRREGLYSGDISRFEQIAREGALKALRNSRPGKKRKTEVSIDEHEVVKQELAEKEHALANLTVEFMTLKKKVNWE